MTEEPRQQNRDAPNNEDKPLSLSPDGVRQGAVSRVASVALRRTSTFRRVVAGVSWLLVLISLRCLTSTYTHSASTSSSPMPGIWFSSSASGSVVG